MIGTIEDGRLWIDGAPVNLEAPAPTEWAGKTVYLKARRRDLEGLPGGARLAWWASRSSWSAAWPTADGKPVALSPLSAWGIAADTLEGAARELEHLEAAAMEEGWTLARSAPSQAGRLMSSLVKPPGQLPPRWRELAHEAQHPGPMVCCAGGGPAVVQVDMIAAYLDCLRAPMPQAWAPVPSGSSWDDLYQEEGILSVMVHVEDLGWTVPPVPLRVELGHTIWPVGDFQTTLSIAYLRRLEGLGVHVTAVLGGALCRMGGPIYAPVADRIEAIRDKKLRKLLYTRAYGRLSGTGGWEGRAEKVEGARQLPGSHLWWTWKGIPPEGSAWPHYRPDHGAAVLDRARVGLFGGLLGLVDVVAVHVDAIWTRDLEGAAALVARGGWAKKGEGPGRWWGAGVYEHGGRVAAMGWDKERHGPPTPEKIQAWAEAGGAWTETAARYWTPAPPAVAGLAAESAPRWVDQPRPEGEHPVLSDRWTVGGWVRKGKTGPMGAVLQAATEKSQ